MSLLKDSFLALVITLMSPLAEAVTVTDRNIDLNQSFTLVQARERETAFRDAPVLCYRLGCEAPQAFDAFLGYPGTGKTFPPLEDVFGPRCLCDKQLIKVASCAPLKYSGSKCQLNEAGRQHLQNFRREGELALDHASGPTSALLVAAQGQRWLPDISDYFYRFDEVKDGEGRYPLVKNLNLLVDRLAISRDDLGNPLIEVLTPGQGLRIDLNLQTAINPGVKDQLAKLYPYAEIAVLPSSSSRFVPRDQQLVDGIHIALPDQAFQQPETPYQLSISIDQEGINGLACVMEYTRKLEHILQIPNYRALDIIMGSLQLSYGVWDWERIMAGESGARTLINPGPIRVDLSEAMDAEGFDLYGNSLESLIVRSAATVQCRTP